MASPNVARNMGRKKALKSITTKLPKSGGSATKPVQFTTGQGTEERTAARSSASKLARTTGQGMNENTGLRFKVPGAATKLASRGVGRIFPSLGRSKPIGPAGRRTGSADRQLGRGAGVKALAKLRRLSVRRSGRGKKLGGYSRPGKVTT